MSTPTRFDRCRKRSVARSLESPRRSWRRRTRASRRSWRLNYKNGARAAAAATGTTTGTGAGTAPARSMVPTSSAYVFEPSSRPVFGVDAPTRARDAAASRASRDFSSATTSSSERAARMDRAQRFAREAVQFASDIANAKGRGTPTMQEMKMRDAAAVGTNESLEKTYLRLTEAPSMATVRPPRVLARALNMVKAKWDANRDYEYAKDQLKSIRQDLTVQHVRDGALVRETYQTHARVALECSDLAEYNQCQAVLKTLHANLLEDALAANARRGETSTSPSGKKKKKKTSSSRKRLASERDGDDDENTDANADTLEDIAEFAAYRLIYAAGAGSKSERSAALARELRDVPDALRRHAFVSHAVSACETLASSNFHRFFALRTTAPRMSARLMDIIAPSVRFDAARALPARTRRASPPPSSPPRSDFHRPTRAQSISSTSTPRRSKTTIARAWTPGRRARASPRNGSCPVRV